MTPEQEDAWLAQRIADRNTRRNRHTTKTATTDPDVWLAERIATKHQRRTQPFPGPADGDNHPPLARDYPTTAAQATFIANLHRDDWMKHAACRGLTPQLFHPERGESTEPAEAVCATCPVADQCLEMAIADSSLIGVWGGMSRRERQAERLRRGIVNPNGRRQTDGPVRKADS